MLVCCGKETTTKAESIRRMEIEFNVLKLQYQLEKNMRLDLLVNQHFIFIYVEHCTIVNVEITTQD